MTTAIDAKIEALYDELSALRKIDQIDELENEVKRLRKKHGVPEENASRNEMMNMYFEAHGIKVVDVRKARSR